MSERLQKGDYVRSKLDNTNGYIIAINDTDVVVNSGWCSEKFIIHRKDIVKESLRIGDRVRLKDKSNLHDGWVTEIYGDKITVVTGNGRTYGSIQNKLTKIPEAIPSIGELQVFVGPEIYICRQLLLSAKTFYTDNVKNPFSKILVDAKHFTTPNQALQRIGNIRSNYLPLTEGYVFVDADKKTRIVKKVYKDSVIDTHNNVHWRGDISQTPEFIKYTLDHKIPEELTIMDNTDDRPYGRIFESQEKICLSFNWKQHYLNKDAEWTTNVNNACVLPRPQLTIDVMRGNYILLKVGDFIEYQYNNKNNYGTVTKVYDDLVILEGGCVVPRNIIKNVTREIKPEIVTNTRLGEKKMFRKLVYGAAAIGAFTIASYITPLGSYIGTGLSGISDSIRGMIPLETQIKHAERQIEKLDKEVVKNKVALTKEKINIEILRENLEKEAASLSQSKDNIKQMRDNLGTVMLTRYGTEDRAKKVLAIKFNNFKAREISLLNSQALVTKREETLSAAEQKFNTMLDLHRQMKLDVETLKSRLALAESGTLKNIPEFDTSSFGRVAKLLEEIEKSIMLKERFIEEPPIESINTEEIEAVIDSHFATK